MSFNSNNGNLNRLNIPLPINLQSTLQATPSNEPLLTPRSFQKIIFTASQHFQEHFDYQTYFNLHGLSGRRSVSPVYLQPNAQAPSSSSSSMNFHAAFQNYSNNMNQKAVAQSFSHFPTNYNLANNNQHHHYPPIHYGISNTYSLVEPSTPNALKIPTTPTRSKSLSPSLRTVIQPPRIRHKPNVATSNMSVAASTTTLSSNNNVNNNKRPEEQRKSSNTLPIMTNNPLSGNHHQSQLGLFLKQQQQQQQQQQQKHQEEQLQTKKQTQQIQIQKPIPILPNKPIGTHLPIAPQLGSLILKEEENTKKILNEPSKNIEKENKIEEKKDEKKKEESEKNEKKTPKNIKFKLPLNSRMINFNNFPQNSNWKKSLNKLKNPDLQNFDYCLSLLRKNLQESINEKIKKLLDDYKNEYIEPMIENLRKNYGNNETSEEDAYFMCIEFLDQAKEIFTNKVENLNKLKTASNDIESTIRPVTKRKSLYEAFVDKMTAKQQQQQQQLQKSQDHENNDETNIDIDTKIPIKKAKLNESKDDNYLLTSITTDTKFVLGKNANKLYMLNTTSTPSSLSTTSTTNFDNDSVSNNNKSIYTKYPYFFKYESDQSDKQWLYDNSIVKKKMVKLYIFLYNDLIDLFSTANFNYDNENNSDKSAVESEEYETNLTNSCVADDQQRQLKQVKKRNNFINKKLKPFLLPQSMVNKIKKQYINFKKKNNVE